MSVTSSTLCKLVMHFRKTFSNTDFVKINMEYFAALHSCCVGLFILKSSNVRVCVHKFHRCVSTPQLSRTNHKGRGYQQMHFQQINVLSCACNQCIKLNVYVALHVELWVDCCQWYVH